MSEIFVPESTPPQVAPEAKQKLAETILERGLLYLWDTSLPIFGTMHVDLKRFIVDGVEFDELGAPLLDDRPVRAFRLGAVVAGRAYLESGYDQGANGEAFTLATMDAGFEGVPEAYLTSYYTDPELQSLVDIVADAPGMQDDVDGGSYEQLVAIGAGCTRHYLKYAVSM